MPFGPTRGLRELWEPSSNASAGRWFLPTCAVAFVIMVVRRPGALFGPQLWAEDGVIFFKQQLVYGFADVVTTPVAGYLYLAPRLVAGAAALLPMRLAPVVYALASLTTAAVVCAWFVRREFRSVIPDDRLRVLASLLFAAAATGWEIIGNVTNLQWYLLWLNVLLLLAPLPRTSTGRGAFLFAVALIGLSGPAALALVPLWAIRIVVERRWSARILPLAAILFPLLAAFQLDPHAGPSLTGTPTGIRDLLLWRVAAAPFLGETPRSGLTLAVPLLAVAAELVAAAMVVRTGTARMTAALAILVVSVTLLVASFISGRPLLLELGDPGRLHQGGRYFWVPVNAMIVICCSGLAATTGTRRLALAVPVLAIIAASLAARPLMPLPNQHWHRSVARLEQAMTERRSCTLRMPITPVTWAISVRLVDGRPAPDDSNATGAGDPCSDTR